MASSLCFKATSLCSSRHTFFLQDTLSYFSGSYKVVSILRVLTVPPYTRWVWYYNKADFAAIRKSIQLFAWSKHLDNMTCPNEEVNLLNEVLLNIHSNFIPNKVKTIKPRQALWITQAVKNFLRKKIVHIKV